MGNGKRFAVLIGCIIFVLLGTIYPAVVFADSSQGNIMVAFNSTCYGSDGYDYNGYDRDGYDRHGYDRNGRDKYGYDRNGRDKYGYDKNGRDRNGYDRYGWDINGRDRNGCDRDGYDRDGYDRYGWHRNGHDRNGHEKNSTSSFSIQKDSSFDAHGDLDFLRVDIDTPFPIYVFLTNRQHTQALTANQDIELSITLIAPDGKKFVQNNLVIEQGNTYATMEISGSYKGLWTVQVTGDPGFDPDTGNNGNNGHSNDNNGDGNGNNGKNGKNGNNGNNGNSNHSNDNNGDGNGNNGNNGKHIITVSSHFWVNKAPSSTGLLVTPETATVIKDGTQQFKATYKWHIRFFFIFEIDHDFDLTNYVTWSSSAPCASIDSKGLARGINSGTATITAYKDWSWIANILGLSDQIDTATLIVVNDKTLTGLSIDPASATIPANGTIQYSAQLVYSDNSTQPITNVSWASSDTQIAPIDTTGLVTGKGGSQNTITITATYTDSNGVIYNGTSNLSVLPVFSINPVSATMLPNDTLQFNAHLVYYDGTQTDVTSSTEWSSSNNQLMTINSDGLATSIGGGECSITATYLDSSGNNYSANTTLSILPILNVIPSSPSIAQGESLQLSAQLQYGDGTKKEITDLTWISTNPEVATIDASGKATGLAGGTSLIIVEDPVSKITGKTVLTVLPSIVITPSQVTIARKAEQQFNVQLLYANDIETDITNSAIWTSSDTQIATIDESGKAKAKNKDGKSTITATDPETNVSASASLTVTNVSPTISIEPLTATISPGEDLQFRAQLVYPDSDSQDITNDAIWSSSNDKVATIDPSKGKATGVGGGTCTITVTDPETQTTGTTTIIVRPILSISPSSISIDPGSTHQFSAELIYADQKTDVTKRVTWSSSNIFIASIGIDGKVTGYGGGFCTITASDSETGLSSNAGLIVLPAMRITPSEVTISTGSRQVFTAQLVYYNRVTDIIDNLSWQSSDSNVANIDNTGSATGGSTGTCTITAIYTATGIEATASLTVLQLSIIPESGTINLGDTRQYNAYLVRADGQSEDVTDRVTWSSSNSDLVSINYSDTLGLAKGVSAGTCTITVNIEPGISATTSVRVLPRMTIIPESSTIYLGGTQQFKAYLVYNESQSQEVTDRVTWGSSDPEIGRIDDTGDICLAEGLSAGTCIVTAYDSITNLSHSVNITVTDEMTLIVEPFPLGTTAIHVGDKQQFIAKLEYGNGLVTNVTNLVSSWVSSDTKVASIDDSGLVTGVDQGETSISATVEFLGKHYTGNYLLKVYPLEGGVILEWERLN